MLSDQYREVRHEVRRNGATQNRNRQFGRRGEVWVGDATVIHRRLLGGDADEPPQRTSAIRITATMPPRQRGLRVG